jgi:hypothetical protein
MCCAASAWFDPMPFGDKPFLRLRVVHKDDISFVAHSRLQRKTRSYSQ